MHKYVIMIALFWGIALHAQTEAVTRAFADNNLTKMEQLLSEGEVDLTDNGLLFEAFKLNKKEMAKLLIDYGIYIETPQKEGIMMGWFPLLDAILKDQYSLAKYLIKKGVNVNQKMHLNDYNETALMLASSEEDVSLVEMLLENGADIHAVNRDGEGALAYAFHSSYPNDEMIATLIAAKATIGKTAKEKKAFLAKFFRYLSRTKEFKNAYVYCAYVANQLSYSNDTQLNIMIRLLFASLYESAIVTDQTLSKEKRKAFKTFAKRDKEGKLFLEMFDIILDSKSHDVKERVKKWYKEHPKGIENRWNFDALKAWAGGLKKEKKKRVMETIEAFEGRQ